MRRFSTSGIFQALRRPSKATTTTNVMPSKTVSRVTPIASTATSKPKPTPIISSIDPKIDDASTRKVSTPTTSKAEPLTATTSKFSPDELSNVPKEEPNEELSFDEEDFTSFQGLGSKPFDSRVIDILMAPVVKEDVEITPDGLLYLPEIKYRRILNRAFGPGGWGIAPRSKTLVTKRQVSREYGLVCLGRLVSVSRGEMDFFSQDGITTAMEGCKSNALMRCCKDLGIASELWDPGFIRNFKSSKCDSKYFEKKRRFVWKRKDRQWEYPYI